MAYTPEQRKEICDRVCNGIMNKMALRDICAQKGMPTKETIRVWLLEDADFSAQYARAREARADARAEFIDELCEDVKAGQLDPNAARVIIDAQKWQAGKENSTRYGDRINVDGDLNFRLSDEQIESRFAQLIGKAGVALALGGKGAEEGAA